MAAKTNAKTNEKPAKSNETQEAAATDGKSNLKLLAKIAPGEFERHFRDWVERDEVARELQAKLRFDLISNFNKTLLGKQILAQTTTTFGGGGSSTQRLTLSPLILALNTMVAEFLYAQNCHFSLSIFCTEMPFRNTLPDFELSRCFRFTAAEIEDICNAISGVVKCEKNLMNDVVKAYEQNAEASLLLLVLKALVEHTAIVATTTKPTTTTKTTMTTPVLDKRPSTEAGKHTAAGAKDYRTEIYNSNFRYLNKYLIVLSHKVKAMARQFERLQEQRHPNTKTLPCSRWLKSARTRKYEHLNRSLERVTENLKQMTQTKRKSKRIGSIVHAIETLSTQFASCATNFENVTKWLASDSGNRAKATSLAAKNDVVSAEQQTEGTGVTQEKTYVEWVREMRHSANGQKFLDRIEVSLRKALNRQKEQLINETDMKLRHQKEMLRMHYKQRLIEQISKYSVDNNNEETSLFNENISKKLRLIELKHVELLERIESAEREVRSKSSRDVSTQSPSKSNVHTTQRVTARSPKTSPTRSTKTSPARSPKTSPTRSVKKRAPPAKHATNTKKQLQNMVRNIAQQGRHVDYIVYDAKLRLQELEHESNQLEQNFRAYLDRSRLQKEAACAEHERLWRNYEKERREMKARNEKNKATKVRVRHDALNLSDETEGTLDEERQESLDRSSDLADCNIEFKNAIAEAKRKFLEAEELRKNQTQRILWEIPDLNLNNERAESYETDADFTTQRTSSIKPFFYNRNYREIETGTTVCTAAASTLQNGRTSDLTVDMRTSSQTVESARMTTIAKHNARAIEKTPCPSPEQPQQHHRKIAFANCQRQLFDAKHATKPAIVTRKKSNAEGALLTHSNTRANSHSYHGLQQLQQQQQQQQQHRQHQQQHSLANQRSNSASRLEPISSTNTSLVLRKSMEKMQQIFAQKAALEKQEQQFDARVKAQHKKMQSQRAVARHLRNVVSSTSDDDKDVEENDFDDDDDDDDEDNIYSYDSRISAMQRTSAKSQTNVSTNVARENATISANKKKLAQTTAKAIVAVMQANALAQKAVKADTGSNSSQCGEEESDVESSATDVAVPKQQSRQREVGEASDDSNSRPRAISITKSKDHNQIDIDIVLSTTASASSSIELQLSVGGGGGGAGDSEFRISESSSEYRQ